MALIVISNTNIYAIGIMFEPYEIDSSMKSFDFYITKYNIKNGVKGFKKYEYYENEYIYKEAITIKETVL